MGLGNDNIQPTGETLNKIYNYSLYRLEFKFNFQRVNRKEGERAMRKSAPCNLSNTDIDLQICKRDIQRV